MVKRKSAGCETAIKREPRRLGCKKSIKFCALLPSERSNCVDHKKQKAFRAECESRELGEARWRRGAPGER